jgi:cytochrome c-type biogenesis protein CcmH/NrfG
VSERARVSARRVVVVLLVALAAYFALIGYRAVILLGESRVTLKVLGAAVLVLPLVGVWVVVAELRFGAATQRLAAQLDEPAPELPRTPSGRIDRASADAYFAECRTEVEAEPDDWRGWFRLAEAYDFAGDRRRARSAMRKAIALAE